MTIAGWRRTALFHAQLAALLDAGLPIGRAVALAGDAAGGAAATAASAWAARCEGGEPLSSSLESAGEEPLVVALVRAGERSGRLPDCCRRLAAIGERLVRTRNEALGRLIYPVLLLHVALVVPALPPAVLGTASPLWMLAGPAALWGVVAAVAVTGWATGRSGLLARLALRPPLAQLALPLLTANAATVLQAAFSAGMRVQESFALAADACGNRLMRTHLRQAGEDIERRRLDSVAAGLAASGIRGDLLALVQTAEVGGRLDQALGQVATVAEERFASRLRWTCKVFTGAIYAIALLTAAATVLSMAAGYVQTISAAAEAAGG